MENIEKRIELYLSGEEKKAYEWLGQHVESDKLVFRVFAPSASDVFLVGDFNGWEESCPMARLAGGFWEVRLPVGQIPHGGLYKYKIKSGGESFFRADPFCRQMDKPPFCASVVVEDDKYRWRDGGWMAQRSESAPVDVAARPLNIYEMHLGSWIKQSGRDILSYSSIAEELAPYVKQMGYTHVELLPVASHPYFGSWGYGTGGYFAPDSRYGEPWELKRFVDTLHRAGIGVIFDLTLTHFIKDEFGLMRFDGSHLYEYGDERRDIAEWGTVRFDVGRPQVASFLISNAHYWIECFHADGIRVDAVSEMIYPRGREKGVCGDAVAFLQRLTGSVRAEHPDVITVAEDSSGYEGATTRNGLGFDLKWNMGWAADTLAYVSESFEERSNSHSLLNFPLTYAFDEKHILPVSHDTVSKNNRSLLDRMAGDYWQKFAGARAFETFRMTSPGKKLSFMGSEIGQFCPWDHERELDWFLLDFEAHNRHQLFVADLNNFYLAEPALWQRDGGWDGFEWIDPDDSERGIVSYLRVADNHSRLAVVINFKPTVIEDYLLPLPEDGYYEEVFNSDDRRYGGSGVTNSGARFSSRPNPQPLSGRAAESILPYSVRLRLPPLGATVLKLVEPRFHDDEAEASLPDTAEKPTPPPKKRRGISKLPPPGRKRFL